MKKVTSPLSAEQFNALKSGFVKQGTSFSRWCLDHGLNRANTKSAILGSWNGPKACELRTEAVIASGIYNELI
ncbi:MULTISPECIES: hypothetical protein [Vibrio]|uniref:Phage-associated protein, BcepMu gp16 family n=1 Tax=Vibrio cincinnatiensis DSM 19608 TaxID=1123491 RepID=A0A1T4SEQ6_VIBCI|nr:MULTISPECIES: hypothetical protein [Vibrio]MDA5312305.1 hypothetical protein [Vibrio cholerae]SKA26672.1 hypothetical protein SAMN02745782_03242 [Vibrio cincinnatiensis DSM 19608]SUP05934.1 Uncharacterised protein [Vibrio cincinnatiensis]